MHLAALVLAAALQLIPAPARWTPAEGTVNEEAKVVSKKTQAFREEIRTLEPWQRKEAYRITLTARRVRIEYASVTGLFRAMTTLEQLGDKRPCGEIFDYPRFRHRGLMIDESRSFKGIPFLKKQIDAMALLKLNVLHLHLTDSAGWRIEIKRRPALTEKTAWRIGWDEILDTGVPEDAVVQSWRGTSGGLRASQAGHDVIMSPSSHCYLNYYQDLIRKEPKATGTLTSLHWCHDYDPVGEGMDPAHVFGLQGNLWCEYLPSPEQAEYMLYPRLFAIAETGWSPAGKKNYEDFRERARRLLETLKKKGYDGFDMDAESELARSPWNNFPDYEKHRHDDTPQD